MVSPAKTLKASNRWKLTTAIGFNIALFLALSSGQAELQHAAGLRLAGSILTGGAGLIGVAVLNALLSPMMKPRLVFWRWKDPLPGGRAFTKYGPADPRVDMTRLQAVWGPLPLNGLDQNATWYRWFKESDKDPVIEASHREFLLFRDLAALALLSAFSLGVASIWCVDDRRRWFYLGFLLVQYLAVATGARNLGERLVTNVLAWKANTARDPRLETAPSR